MQVRAKKFLGQHFLTDKNIAHKIVKALQTKEGAVLNVLEVGPGMGVLTDFMVTDQAISLSVIDIDRESIAFLEKKYPTLGDRIISGDFLNLAFEKFVEPGKDFAIIGNFPYNISSQILFKVLDNKEKVSQMVGMFQKEVAERIVAKAGTKAYGILSVLMQADYEIEYLFTVNPGVFNPPPKVKSAVISALRNTINVYDGANENLFREIVKAAFNQRRKTLRNALRKYLTPTIQDEKMFDLRAERLSVNDFVWLTKLISKAIDEKNNFKILVTEDIHQIYFDELASANILVDDRSNVNSRDELKALLPMYDGMLVRSKFFVDEDLIAGAKNLKMIARAGAGMDNIDEVYCQANGITLINAPEGNRDAVAEHVIGMLLNLMRNISKSNAEIKNGIWLREENRGIEIGGKKIGIIGYGNTGKALAKKLSGFGVSCIAYDKYLVNYSDQFAQEVSLNELQNSADIISIHVPLTAETKYLINDAFIANLKNGVVILNASRGPILQTAALIQYINSGKVAYAALDVLENEKIDQLDAAQQREFDQLCKESKVLLTSHIAGWTDASYYKIASILAQKTIQFLQQAIN